MSARGLFRRLWPVQACGRHLQPSCLPPKDSQHPHLHLWQLKTACCRQHSMAAFSSVASTLLSALWLPLWAARPGPPFRLPMYPQPCAAQHATQAGHPMQPGIASLLLPQAGHLTGRSPHAGIRSGNGPWIEIQQCPPGTARPTAARRGGQAWAGTWRCHCSAELAAMGHPDPCCWPAAAGVSLHEDMAQHHQLIPPVRHTGL